MINFKKNKENKKSIMSIIITFVILFNRNYIFGITNTKNYIDVNVKSAVVIDHDSKRILYNHEAHEKRYVASLTKMMTSILLVENCDVNEIVTVPKSIINIGGSTIGLKEGDKIKVKDLLIGMLLPSRKRCGIYFRYLFRW